MPIIKYNNKKLKKLFEKFKSIKSKNDKVDNFTYKEIQSINKLINVFQNHQNLYYFMELGYDIIKITNLNYKNLYRYKFNDKRMVFSINKKKKTFWICDCCLKKDSPF